ncbi:DUF6113 family protein [Streptosporangium sp. CA-135522]|uniref:DUF6113 family protein n=1 Tax=Streptosporangium sp. CA-135522 TaxID=3240072 RepID=UPI003D8BFA3C
MVVMEQVQAAGQPSEATVTGAAYAMLILLGLMTGVVGGLQHSWTFGSVPVAAIGWVVLLFAAGYGAGRAMRGKLAALAPGAGWTAVTLIWLGGRPEGDVIIANDLSGYVYLYGGLIAILAAVLLAPSGDGAWLLAQRSYGSRPIQPDLSRSMEEDRYRGSAG